MDFVTVIDLVNKNGLAIVLLLLILWGGYQLFSPYIKKKLNNRAENDDKLEDSVHKGYFQLVKENSKQLEESRKSNERITTQLELINTTNRELSETNKRLVESYDKRICILEQSTDEIGKTVEKINTKIDVMLK